MKTEAKVENLPKIVTPSHDLKKALKKDLDNLELSLTKAGATVEIKETPKEKGNGILFPALAIGLVVFVAVWVIGPKGKLVPWLNKDATHFSSVESVEKSDGLSGGTQQEVNPITSAMSFLKKGTEMVDKNPREAKSLLLKAIELDPKNAQAHFQLGLTYMALKNSHKAMEAYQKSIQLDPNFPEAYFNLGYLYGMEKNYSKAEEKYSQVVKMAPSYLDEALFNLALVQEKQGKMKKSIENLERALQVNPENEMAQKFLNNLKVGSR